MPTILQLKCSLSAMLWDTVPVIFVSRRPVMRWRFTFPQRLRDSELVSNGQNLYFIEGKLLFYEIFIYLWVYRLCVLLVVLVSRIGKGAISKWFPLQTIDEVRSCSFSSNLTVQVIYENNVTILSWLVYRKRGILDQNKYFFYAFLGEKSVFVLSLFALADMSL